MGMYGSDQILCFDTMLEMVLTAQDEQHKRLTREILLEWKAYGIMNTISLYIGRIKKTEATKHFVITTLEVSYN